VVGEDVARASTAAAGFGVDGPMRAPMVAEPPQPSSTIAAAITPALPAPGTVFHRRFAGARNPCGLWYVTVPFWTHSPVR
jgi:hypothetical protein